MCSRTSDAKSSASAALRWCRRHTCLTTASMTGKIREEERLVLQRRSGCSGVVARRRRGAGIVHVRRPFDLVDGHTAHNSRARMNGLKDAVVEGRGRLGGATVAIARVLHQATSGDAPHGRRDLTRERRHRVRPGSPPPARSAWRRQRDAVPLPFRTTARRAPRRRNAGPRAGPAAAPAPCTPRCRRPEGVSRERVVFSSLVSASGARTASPKSSNFTRPSDVIMMFELLRSRCTMPCLCACATASAICIA